MRRAKILISGILKMRGILATQTIHAIGFRRGRATFFLAAVIKEGFKKKSHLSYTSQCWQDFREGGSFKISKLLGGA